MSRLGPTEIREYWERHADLRAPLELLDEDPDGLANVCHPGQPGWLNRYYARFQRRVYEELLTRVRHRSGARALDVGCGAGRWSRLLADSGYETVGIDLQEGLVEANRRRHPDIEFHVASAQGFTAATPFDLISTVTVIQHIPFDEQVEVVERFRSLAAPGGYVIALENVRDQGPHVFSRSIAGWRELFEGVGFETVTQRRYDYSPSLRAFKRITAALLALHDREAAPPTAATLNAPVAHASGGWRGAARSARAAAMRGCVVVDGAIEPVCLRLRLDAPTVHCGFLFRRT